MTIKRVDHVSVVVEDLSDAVDFFVALGMTHEAGMPFEGAWLDRVSGLHNLKVDIAMMRTPDGHGRVALAKFRNPPLVTLNPRVAPQNSPGIRSLMFLVTDLNETLRRLRELGADLVGGVAQYDGQFRLCYVRGPSGILVGLSEELRAPRRRN